MRRFHLGLFLTTVAICAASSPAYSQSCSLCYTQAASATTQFIQALRSGIIVLIIPPLLISAWLTYLAYRKRNQFKGFPNANESEGGW